MNFSEYYPDYGSCYAGTGNYYLFSVYYSNEEWLGKGDEFQFDSTSRSDDWIKAVGSNLSDPENFWSYEDVSSKIINQRTAN